MKDDANRLTALPDAEVIEQVSTIYPFSLRLPRTNADLYPANVNESAASSFQGCKRSGWDSRTSCQGHFQRGSGEKVGQRWTGKDFENLAGSQWPPKTRQGALLPGLFPGRCRPWRRTWWVLMGRKFSLQGRRQLLSLYLYLLLQGSTLPRRTMDGCKLLWLQPVGLLLICSRTCHCRVAFDMQHVFCSSTYQICRVLKGDSGTVFTPREIKIEVMKTWLLSSIIRLFTTFSILSNRLG